MRDASHPTDAILGIAPAVEALRAQIRRLASFDGIGNPHVPTVLLQGETGTGKGLVARVMHDSGPRARGAFVDVNCAAIPEAMLEAELFGFEAGAFTDAKRAKPGLFEAASGGTLFLDEIDSLSIPVQSKVLKAIEEKRVRRLGAVTANDVDVKLIAATQHDLGALAGTGAFRADLYHRLAVLVLAIPPLRQREQDVLQLAQHWLASYAAAHGLHPKRLDASARAWLAAYTWPGNVRELGHMMERVTLLAPADEISADTLGELAATTSLARPAPVGSAAPSQPDVSLDAADEARIRAALERAGGNVVRAARLLGIGRNALRYRMRRLGINRPDVDEIPAMPARAETPARPPTAPAAAPQAPNWEQKPAAVLVVALTFPDAGDAVGYEPWTQATRWDRFLGERIEGFGGSIVQRSPSRLTAIFGVPRAVEQLPQRAAHAALAIQRALAHEAEPRPEIRCAVHVGEVRIDTSSPEPLLRLLPIGDTFAFPERLLGHAGAGEILLSAQAARRVAPTCELVPRPLQLGPHDADRITALVLVGQARDASDAAEALRSEPTRFVGRTRELDLLHDAFVRVSSGHGQVVFISGDAGMGKSRLLAEFRRRLDGTEHTWVEGRCAAYGTSTPFLPVIDAVRHYVGIDDHDDEASATAKIVSSVGRLGEDLDWALPFVKQLLSLRVGDHMIHELDSASRRSELFRAMSTLMLRAAEQRPLVLVIEDLHWIDQASEEYFSFVAETIPAARVLLVLSHRSGYTVRLPDRSYHLRIALPPLSGGEMATMTGSVLGDADVPAALESLIASKAEGNPFFIEELTKSLLEEGALQREDGSVRLARALNEISVPDTIQDVLIARIDRLADESRRAIQVAAVIGREFALRLLARITEAGERIRNHVDELRSLELIYEKALHPELAYMFKHALTHDVAYESVMRERRILLHRTIGSAIEELYADRLPEHYETLAHHFSRGEDWERALTYHERSAEKAAINYANRAVVEHCRQALSIAERHADQVSHETRRCLNEQLGRACFFLSEFAASGAAYEAAATNSADSETRVFNLAAAAFAHFWGHEYEPARRCIDEALLISRRENLPVAEARALTMHGFYGAIHDADLNGYERHAQHALTVCARAPRPEVESLAHFELFQVYEWTGDYARAFEHAEHALTIARNLRLPDIMIFTTWFLGKARCVTGDYGGAIAVLEEAYGICDRLGDRAWKSRLLNTLGWCFAEIGSIERARVYNERAAVLAREIGDAEICANADINLTGNYLSLGDLDGALRAIEPVETALARSTDPWMRWRYALHAHNVRGRLELAHGNPAGAAAEAERELEGARRHRAPKVEAIALLLRAEALLTMDLRDEADAAVREALQIGKRIGYQRGVWQAHGLLADLERRAGNTAGAATHSAEAHALIERAAQTVADDELRRRLLASALR